MMGTEIREEEALIESYLSFVLHNRDQIVSHQARVGATFSDIEMRHQVLRNDRSNEAEDRDEAEDEEDMKKEGRQLLQAAREDDSVRVMELLALNPRLISYREPNTEGSIMHVVARCGHKSTFIKLMNFIKIHKHSTFMSKSPLQKREINGDTPLHVALKHGHKEVASLLIEEMPPDFVFARNNDNIMPVNQAIRGGYKDLLMEMFQQAPWISLSQSTRKRLMRWSNIVHHAIHTRDLGLLQMVLEKMPILIGARTYQGKPLEYAACKGYIEEVCYILDNFPGLASNSSNNGRSPVHSAIAGNHLDIVKEIISRYPNTLDDVDKFGCNHLSIASQEGCLDQVCYFLANFPNFASKCDNKGSFPIHKAVAGGHVDIVKEFITHCPETMSQIDGNGRSILHLVVEYTRPNVLSYLRSNPEIEQIYHLRDTKGNTFFDLAKKRMIKWENKLREGQRL